MDPDTHAPPVTRTDTLQFGRDATIALVSLIIVTGFALAVCYHYYKGMYGVDFYTAAHIANQKWTAGKPDWQVDPHEYPYLYIGRQYPANTFLFRPDDMFNDFGNPYDVVKDSESFRRKGWIFMFNYFPFAYLFMAPFLVFSRDRGSSVFLLLFTIAFSLIARSNLKRQSRFDTWRDVVIFSAMTYPFLIEVERANLEGVIFILSYLFVYLVEQGRYKSSAVALGLAIAFKPIPAFLLVLLFLAKLPRESFFACVRRIGLFKAMLAFLHRNREIGMTVFTAIGLSLVAIVILAKYFAYDPGVLSAAWKQTFELYIYAPEGMAFCNSLWGPLKIAVYYSYHCLGANPPQEATSLIVHLARLYSYCTLSLSFGICVYLWRFERTFWKQVALLVFSMNLFPYLSGDYKLLHVFIPLFLFINRKQFERLDSVYAILFALLLIPKNYYRVGEINLGAILNPALMLAMVCLIICSGLLRPKKTVLQSMVHEESVVIAA